MLNSINWSVNPDLVSIGPVTVRWYGLFFMFSFVFGYYILKRMFEKEGRTLELLDKFTIYIAVGTVLGARLGHCFFYDQSGYYLHNPIEIIKIWEGGLASHGGAIGILIAIAVFSRVTKESYLWLVDRLVIVVALAAFFIRMGNLMNSEIYGKATDLPWGIHFLNEKAEIANVARHPTQVYEGLFYLLVFGLLMCLYWKKNLGQKTGKLFGTFLILVFGFRFFIEFLKMPQDGEAIDSALDMGQKLSIPFVAVGIYFLALFKKKSEA